MQAQDRWRMWAALASGFAFGFLSLTALGLAWSFPHAYAPPATDFDTSFMGDLAASDPAPLAIDWLASADETYDGVAITVEDLTYFSHRHDGIDIRIFARFARPRSTSGPTTPGLVLVHGYGGTHASMMDTARGLAAFGYAALAIDAPDSGQSSPYPKRTPENLVNVTGDPRNGFLYHVAYAASRGVSVLDSLPYTLNNAFGVLGASQGGLVSVYLAAHDPRIRAAVPIIAGGNLEEAFLAPSLTHLLVPRDLTAGDARAVAFRRHYDPLGYAANIGGYVLFIVGTTDEFFPLPGVMATYAAIPGPKWLALEPNHGHAASPDWGDTVRIFLDRAFLRCVVDCGLPQPQILEVTAGFFGVRVTARADWPATSWPDPGDALLVYREGTAADRWHIVPMATTGGSWVATASPTWIGPVSVYVVLRHSGVFVTATPPVTVHAVGLAGPLLLVFAAAATAYLVGSLGVRWRARIVPLAAWALATLGSATAWIGIPGRASWGVYEIADRTVLGSGLLLPYLLFFSGMFAAALFRPRKLLVLSWAPLIFSVIAYAIVWAITSPVATITPSWGFAGIAAAPILVLAERRLRKEPPVF